MRTGPTKPDLPKSAIDMRRELRMLKERFDTAVEAYEQLQESSAKAVVRWVWTTAPRFNLDPLFFFDPELGGVGHIVPSPPADPRGWVAYGFSRHDRVVAERWYVSDLDGRYYETFYLEENDRIVSYHFHYAPTQECINCTQLVFAGPYPAYYQKWAIKGWASHGYVTVDGRIRSFNEVFKQEDEPQQRISGELRYGDGGRVEVWTRWPGMRLPEGTFRGMPPAENPFLR